MRLEDLTWPEARERAEKGTVVIVPVMRPSPVFLTPRFDELTISGVIGEPLLATPEKGERLFSAIVDRVAEFLIQFKESYPSRLPVHELRPE